MITKIERAEIRNGELQVYITNSLYVSPHKMAGIARKALGKTGEVQPRIVYK